MGEIVNLRMARKRKLRADKDAAAGVKRAEFGRARAERDQALNERSRADALLEGHRRERDPAEGGQ